jgi:hypothetical protein
MLKKIPQASKVLNVPQVSYSLKEGEEKKIQDILAAPLIDSGL